MVKRLNTSDTDFESQLTDLLAVHSGSRAEIDQAVAEIIADVADRGDAALLEYSKRFDNADLSAEALRVTGEEIERAYNDCDKEVLEALLAAAARIRAYHEQQVPEDKCWQDDAGVTLGWQWRAVEIAGLYVPGGKAAYPSTVLMNAIPALVAGVNRLVMVVPAPSGEVNSLVLAAAKVAGVKEIYKIGGAQAIAALACGTETIPAVDVVVGPGNAYVASAKRQVFGKVGIDMVAGPSEILVIADGQNDPEWIAADLLSQAEHDEDARSILITDNEAFADSVVASVERVLPTLEREKIARASWENNGVVIVTADLDQTVDLANQIAPEHLELAVEDPEALLKGIQNAGAIFLGRYTPEAIGDYMAGPSHTLPTSGTARFSSGLSVYDFLKRSSIISCDAEGFAQLAENTEKLAEEEGLGAHALSVKVRGKGD